MARLKHTGFTLVELIVVIIIVAIVSLYAASRYIGRSSFAPAVAQEQVISVIRQVQVNRMQSNVDIDSIVSNTNFTLSLRGNCVGSQAACVERSDSRSDWVSIDDVTFSSNVGSTINFDLLGSPVDVTPPVVIQMRVSEGGCAAVHINAIGYVSRGNC
ncbi:MAG: prepilin-type N-terminal cleavage/methylation domain-containing protein [Pseudomonadota bacterium]